MPKSRKVQTPADAAPLLSLARQVRGWADTVLSVAGSATDLGLTLAQGRVTGAPRRRLPWPRPDASCASGARPPA